MHAVLLTRPMQDHEMHPRGFTALVKSRELIQSTREAKTAVRSSLVPHACIPINTPQDHEMHPRGFTASVKSRL